jgi:MFS family permease
VGAEGGYGAVLADRGVRRLLAASLAGRLAFAMLPLGLVLFTVAETGSSATAGALVAAFSVTSALAPARGRVVDRQGPPALIAFGVACSGLIAALALAGAVDAPAALLVILAGLAGLVVPPLGPFTRAVWGNALADRLQRVFALDSAGEEGANIVAPLVVALFVALASPGWALTVAAVGMLAGSTASARSPLTRGLAPSADRVGSPRARLPLALWLVIASLLGPGAALGAVSLAVSALARADGAPARAGLILAAFALGTPVASLLAGRRRWRRPAVWRLALLQLALTGSLAAAAVVAEQPVALAAVLVPTGMALGALFVTVYLLVDELTPPGAGTRAFAWLVTANNGGIAFGAAVAGEVISGRGGAAGLWIATFCALAGLVVVVVARVVGPHADIARPSPGRAP